MNVAGETNNLRSGVQHPHHATSYCRPYIGWKIEANARLQVSRIASGVKALPRTIRDASRIESVTSPNNDAAAVCTVRMLFVYNSGRMFVTHSARNSSILVAKVWIVSWM